MKDMFHEGGLFSSLSFYVQNGVKNSGKTEVYIEVINMDYVGDYIMIVFCILFTLAAMCAAFGMITYLIHEIKRLKRLKGRK